MAAPEILNKCYKDGFGFYIVRFPADGLRLDTLRAWLKENLNDFVPLTTELEDYRLVYEAYIKNYPDAVKTLMRFT